VVVVVGGFGGLTAVRAPACADVDVTLVESHDHHLIGVGSRAVVMVRWACRFSSRGRGTRLITDTAGTPPWEEEAAGAPG
jgi:hypothetical protein